MSYLNSFTKKLSNFVEYLQTILLNDPVIPLASMYLEMTEDRLVLLKFYKYVSKYDSKIEMKDESFFITNIGDRSNLQNNKNIIIERLKIHWKELKNNDKETIWKYFKILLILSRKYIDKNHINISEI